jgi:hypothetical protein
VREEQLVGNSKMFGRIDLLEDEDDDEDDYDACKDGSLLASS